MANDHGGRPEIESFNLADLDVSALDARLELTTLIPHGIVVCPGNCSTNCGVNCNVDCVSNYGCNCHSYN
jgi:hypothetical protein